MSNFISQIHIFWAKILLFFKLIYLPIIHFHLIKNCKFSFDSSRYFFLLVYYTNRFVDGDDCPNSIYIRKCVYVCLFILVLIHKKKSYTSKFVQLTLESCGISCVQTSIVMTQKLFLYWCISPSKIRWLL